jgi:hypothetical protein
MTQRMQKFRSEFCFLGTCGKKQRCNYLKHAPAGVLNAVGDAANTVLRGNLPLSTAHRKRLRREIKGLKTLAAKKTSLVTKRKLLASQKGGSILGVLWSVVKSLYS